MAPGALSRAVTQFFPPKPLNTEKNVADLSGKVYIVTGASSGLGKELSRLLYSKNAIVYVTGRSKEKTNEAIASIQNSFPNSTGSLQFLPLNLDDLGSIKSSAELFLAKEHRLHVLFNNAGFQGADGPVERTAHGYERHLQDPSTPPNSVRAIFLSSFAAEMYAEHRTGFRMDNLDYPIEKPTWAHAVEASKRYKNIISFAVNPGNLRTQLFRDQSSFLRVLTSPVLYPAINGAYSHLWAGLSSEVTADNSGDYVAPFGRFYPIRSDLDAATKSETEAGNGMTETVWSWTEQEVKNFL